MTGISNPVRTDVYFLGFHDPSGATGPLFGADDVADDDQGRDIFGCVGIVRSVFIHVIETQSAHIETVTLKWRPTPGSSTGSVDLGTFVVPADITAGTRARADFYMPAVNTATTVQSASPTAGYGIGGVLRTVGDTDVVFGPGGEFVLSDVGSSTAGQYNVWLEVERLGWSKAAATVTALAVS